MYECLLRDGSKTRDRNRSRINVMSKITIHECRLLVDQLILSLMGRVLYSCKSTRGVHHAPAVGAHGVRLQDTLHYGDRLAGAGRAVYNIRQGTRHPCPERRHTATSEPAKQQITPPPKPVQRPVY